MASFITERSATPAAAAAGLIAYALDLYGLVELGRVAEGVAALGVGVSPFAADSYKQLKQQHGELLEQLLRAEDPYRELMRLDVAGLPRPSRNLREVLREVEDEMRRRWERSGAGDVQEMMETLEKMKRALVFATAALAEWLGEHGGLFEEARRAYKELEEAIKSGEPLGGVVEEYVEKLEKLRDAADVFRKELIKLAGERRMEELYVDEGEAVELAKAMYDEFSRFSNASIGAKTYAALLGMMYDTLYGRVAAKLFEKGEPAYLLAKAPSTAYEKVKREEGGVMRRHDATAESGASQKAEEFQLRYLVAFLASLPEDMRSRLNNAWFERKEEKDESGVVKRVMWELKAENGKTLAVFEFRQLGRGWTVRMEGPLAEELKGKLGEKFRQRLQMAPAEMLADAKLAPLLGLLATDLHLEARGGKASQIGLTTSEDWLFATAAALLGKKEPRVSVYVTLEGIKVRASAYWSANALNKAIKESQWVRELLKHGFIRSETVQTLYGPRKKPVETIDELITRLRWDLVLTTLENMDEEIKHLLCGKKERCSAEELSNRFDKLLGEVKTFVGKVGQLETLREKQIQKIYNKARECLAPALLLLELDAALKTGRREEMEEALWRFALVFSAAVAGDGHVDKYKIELISGEGGPALLWLAALYKAAEVQARLMQKADKETGAEAARAVVEVDREIKPSFTPRLRWDGAAYYVVVTGEEGLVNLAALIPAVGLNPKAEEAVMAFREKSAEKPALEVEVKNLRKTAKGAAADVIIRAGGLEAKYTLQIGEKIELRFSSYDPEEVMKAAHLLRLAGVKAEEGKTYREQIKKYVCYVDVTTDRLADKTVDAGLRKKLAEAVRKAAEDGLIRKETAERWAEKLREGVTTAEDMPKFKIRINSSGGLDINYGTTSTEQLNKHVEALRRIGLEEGVHFTAEEPQGNELGRLAITVEGVRKLAELSVHAKDGKTREEAARWVKHLLERAKESGGEEAYERLEELVEEGRKRGAYTLTGLRQEVEIDGERHVVEVKEAKAWIDGEDRLHIWVKAVVDGVEVEREFVFGRYGRNQAVQCFVSLWSHAPGGREADRRRIETLSLALFGDKPGTTSGGRMLKYTRRHLEYAMRFREIKEMVEKWLVNSR